MLCMRSFKTARFSWCCSLFNSNIFTYTVYCFKSICLMKLKQKLPLSLHLTNYCFILCIKITDLLIHFKIRELFILSVFKLTWNFTKCHLSWLLFLFESPKSHVNIKKMLLMARKAAPNELLRPDQRDWDLKRSRQDHANKRQQMKGIGAFMLQPKRGRGRDVNVCRAARTSFNSVRLGSHLVFLSRYRWGANFHATSTGAG